MSDHELNRTTFDDQLARLQHHKKKRSFVHPGIEHDRLFKSAYHHAGDFTSKCTACDQSELVERPQRTEEEQRTLVFHRGRIATGNAVIQDSEVWDEIRARCNGALCVEMEAAGVDANRQCLVIRGISDYANSHKSDMWRSYAAGNAAAFARALLCRVGVSAVPTRPVQKSAMSPRISKPLGPTADDSRSVKHAPAPQTSSEGREKIVKIPKSGTLWSSAEDEMLLHVVETLGLSNWKHVALRFYRDDRACQKRYERLIRRRNGI
jgi:hypothetical protein